MADSEYDIARNSFCSHKNKIFPRSLMLLLFYICLYYSFNNTCSWVSQDRVAILTTKQILIWTPYYKVPTPSILYVRPSGKSFPSTNYPIRKSCVVCAYETNSAGKYKKTKTSNSCKKCLCHQKLHHPDNLSIKYLEQKFCIKFAFSALKRNIYQKMQKKLVFQVLHKNVNFSTEFQYWIS